MTPHLETPEVRGTLAWEPQGGVEIISPSRPSLQSGYLLQSYKDCWRIVQCSHIVERAKTIMYIVRTLSAGERLADLRVRERALVAVLAVAG